MEKMYWDQFLHSGKIKDYLSYKNCIADGQSSEWEDDGRKKEQREPDRIDRDGAFDDSGNMTAGSFCLQKNRGKCRHLQKDQGDRTVRLSEW